LPTVYHFCGLSITTYKPYHEIEGRPSLHGFRPLSVDQASLQKQVASFISSGLESSDPGLASKILFRMPSYIYLSVLSFVTDRTANIHPKYEWTLAAIIDQSPKASLFSRKNKATKATQLVLILRSALRPLSENGIHNLRITYDPWLQIHHHPLTGPYGFPLQTQYIGQEEELWADHFSMLVFSGQA
jgi:hypothetical protein